MCNSNDKRVTVMIIAIASGKGGTGKTTVSTSLALSLEGEVQLLDCDVEEPNASIFIKPKIVNKKPVFIFVPQVNREKCILCGKCAEVCAFNAIAVIAEKVLVYPELCHSCGACQFFCPKNAIQEVEKKIGTIEFGEKNHIKFVNGRLNIGEVMSIPVIKEVKKYLDKSKIVVIDAPPGTSCPMIESVRGCDFCILVTEPTPFGLNDLILAIELLRKMRIPFGVVINRSDLGNQNVEDYCKNGNIIVLTAIPFQKEIAVGYSKGIPLIEIAPKYKDIFFGLLEKIQNILK